MALLQKWQNAKKSGHGQGRCEAFSSHPSLSRTACPLTPDDLESVDPDAYQQKVVYIHDGIYTSRDGMVLQDLDLTFEVELEFNDYSSTKCKRDTEELKPKGADVPVTEENN